MARGTQHRKRRPAANAAVTAPLRRPKKPKPPAWQEQLFFQRLRIHTKWVFVLLAIVFALSFVILGVGSGSTGITSAMQSLFTGKGGSGASISSLQKKTIDQPKNSAAWRALATAYETKSQQDNAISALVQYTTLKPKDQNALGELAGLYLTRAQAFDTAYTNDQSHSEALTPTSIFAPKTNSKLASAISSLSNPIASAVSSDTSTATNDDYSQLESYLSDRLGIYQKLVKLNPTNAQNQYALGQAAADTGDSKTAIKAYKAFLKLAPQDPLASTARSAIKQLAASAT